MNAHLPPQGIAVCADPAHAVPLQQRARALARTLGLPAAAVMDQAYILQLVVTESRLELRVARGEADLVGGHGVCADLAGIDTTSPAGRKLDAPLLKAVGVKKGNAHRPRVIDCTAGLGEDAWLLAAHGCRVTAIERQPVLAALLDDALRRAAPLEAETAQRITLQTADAAAWLSAQTDQLTARSDRPDAIVLDPMFPAGRKAKERKPMRVLRMLVGDDEDAPELLAAALATGVHRVCVKRPMHAPAVDNAHLPEPDVVHKGKAVRFDVYLNH